MKLATIYNFKFLLKLAFHLKQQYGNKYISGKITPHRYLQGTTISRLLTSMVIFSNSVLRARLWYQPVPVQDWVRSPLLTHICSPFSVWPIVSLLYGAHLPPWSPPPVGSFGGGLCRYQYSADSVYQYEAPSNSALSNSAHFTHPSSHLHFLIIVESSTLCYILISSTNPSYNTLLPDSPDSLHRIFCLSVFLWQFIVLQLYSDVGMWRSSNLNWTTFSFECEFVKKSTSTTDFICTDSQRA